MYRSVTQSRLRHDGSRRALHWIQGIVVGVAVLAAVLLLFN
ncbi:MAG: hypothetical protein AAF495_05775 [Pseudomonadota bacterium]